MKPLHSIKIEITTHRLIGTNHDWDWRSRLHGFEVINEQHPDVHFLMQSPMGSTRGFDVCPHSRHSGVTNASYPGVRNEMQTPMGSTRRYHVRPHSRHSGVTNASHPGVHVDMLSSMGSNPSCHRGPQLRHVVVIPVQPLVLPRLTHSSMESTLTRPGS